MRISARTFLISGGASGLGAACCRQFAYAGGNVVVADVDEARGSEVAAEIGNSATFIKTDVTDEQSVARAVQQAVDQFGAIHGAVTCAGIVEGARLIGREGPHDLKKFRRVIDVNLIGTFNVTRLVAAQVAAGQPDDEGERGVIVMTTSVAAWEGQIGQSAYSASKGGVAAMTLPLARELGRYGIRVVSIAPGVFGTPMMQAVNDEFRKSLASQVPFPKRFGRPEEFAALAQHIVENRMLNGAVLRLDGGLRMGPK